MTDGTKQFISQYLTILALDQVLYLSGNLLKILNYIYVSQNLMKHPRICLINCLFIFNSEPKAKSEL